MPQNYFCIEFGESFIKIVDAEYKQGKVEIQGIGLIETDRLYYSSTLEKLLEEQAKKIAKLIAQLKIEKTEVNIIVPDSLSYNRILEMPKLNEKELLSAIKYQADQFVPMPIDQVGLDVEIVLEKGKKTIALLSASSKKIIEKVQKTAEYAGLLADSVETETSAMGRLLSEIFRQSHKIELPKNLATNDIAQNGILFINFGYSSTSAYLYNEQLGIISHMHNFSVGFHLFLKEIEVNIEADQKKAIELLSQFDPNSNQNTTLASALSPAIKDMTREIQQFINLLAERHKISIKSSYIFNEVVRFKGVQKIIEQAFHIPCSIFDLNPHISNSNSVSFIRNELSLFPAVIGGTLR